MAVISGGPPNVYYRLHICASHLISHIYSMRQVHGSKETFPSVRFNAPELFWQYWHVGQLAIQAPPQGLYG